VSVCQPYVCNNQLQGSNPDHARPSSIGLTVSRTFFCTMLPGPLWECDYESYAIGTWISDRGENRRRALTSHARAQAMRSRSDNPFQTLDLGDYKTFHDAYSVVIGEPCAGHCHG